MKVFIERQQKHVTVTFTGKVKDLLKKVKINPETVLIVRNGTLVTEDDVVKNNDEIKLISVISGG